MDCAIGEDGTVMLWISYSALAKFPEDDKKRSKDPEFDTLHCLDATDPDIDLIAEK
jgi:hypothetical protein